MPKFYIVVDHKPLIGIFNKDLAQVKNARLKKYQEKLTKFVFDIEWREGKTHCITDALSQAPHFPAPEQAHEESCCNILQEDPKLQSLKEAADSNQNCQMIVEAIIHGHNPKDLPSIHPARQFSTLWDNISCNTHRRLLLLQGCRIIVPKAKRKDILDLLHIPHCGIHKT
jgi:hypothetical protein